MQSKRVGSQAPDGAVLPPGFGTPSLPTVAVLNNMKAPRSIFGPGSCDENSSTGLLLWPELQVATAMASKSDTEPMPRQASLLDAAAQFLRGELESLAEALPQEPPCGQHRLRPRLYSLSLPKDTRRKEAKTASALGLLRELRRRTSSLQRGADWTLHASQVDLSNLVVCDKHISG